MKVPYQLLRAARAAIDMTHVDLAREAGVSKRTLVRIEALQGVSEDSRARVQSALEARGVVFLPAGEGIGPGIGVPDKMLTAPAERRYQPPGKRIDRKP